MIIKHVKPPVQDKLKAHYFDRYANTFDGNKLLSSVGDQSEGREIQPGRCYDFDGVDDYIAITSPNVGTLYVSGLGSDGELNTTLTIGYFSNQYQISGSGKIWNIKVWTSGTATETQKKSYILESGLFAWYKCDEGAGVNSYDSSGNGNHGTITNASLETFHSTQSIYSWQNEVGYSIGKSFSINPTDTVNSINDGGSTVYNIPDGGTYWFNTSDELDPDGEPVNVWTEAGLNIYRSSNMSGVTSATSQLFRLQPTVVSGRFIIRADVHQGTINRINYRYRGYYTNFITQHNLTFGELPPSSLTVEQFYYALSGNHPEHGEQYPETVLGLSGATSSQYRDVLFNAGIEDPILFTDLLGTSNIFLEVPTSTNWDYVLTPIVDFNPQINANNNSVIFSTDDLYATGQLGIGTTGYFSILQRSLPTVGNFLLASNTPIWFKLKQFSFDSATIIPRNESDPSKDVLGNDLEFKGQVAYNALAKQSNCLYLDGIDDVIQFADTTGWDRLENAGTSELSINGNNIEGTEGSVYNLRVYDSADNLIAHYPCSEGGGLRVYDVISNDYGTLVNATLETVWAKQDEYHYNIKEGYSNGKGFSTRVTDVRDNTDTNYRYTSQEGIDYYYSYGDDVNPTTGRYDPDGNPLGYTSEYFNFYKELISGVTGGSSIMSIVGSFSANTFKIDLEVKSGAVSLLQGRDNSLLFRFNTALIDTYGFAGNTVFTDQEDFYWAISGLGPTYGESYPEINGFPIGTTSEDLRNLLVSIGIEDIEYFVSDLSNYTDRATWQYCLQRTFSIPLNINNTYGRTEIELGVFDIKPNGAVSTGNMANYYSQYNTNLELYSNLNLRCLINTWVHFYSITIDENHVVPASQSNHNQDATGLKLENIAGRHHNGAETLIDFTGGIESPYAVQFELPNNYAFGDPMEYKEEANNIEKNILIYDGVDSVEDIRIKNFIKDI